MKFVLGFAIGVALGMVFAPAPGSDTRRELKNKIRELGRYPEQKIEEKVQQAAASVEQKAGEIGSRVGRDAAQAAVKAVTSEVLEDDQKHTA
ncbi:MAG TPA: YtxH domain-containing protein [Terriglobales bacterium]|nr:YtxH domain-containing protein [Terriglobales bacterium]